MSTYSLKTQATYLTLGKLAAFVFSGLSPIILTRLMTTDDYGVYRQVWFIAKVFLVLMSLDTHKSLYYFFPRIKLDYGRLISHTYLILAFTSLIGALIFFIIGRFFSLLPTGLTSEFVLPIAIWIAIENLAYILDHIFVLEKKSRVVFSLNCANVLLRLFLVISVFVIFKSVIMMVYALVVFSCVRLVVFIFYVARNYAIRFNELDLTLLTGQIKYIGPLATSNLMWLVGANIDKAIIGATMSTTDFAIYAIGSLGVINAVTLVYTSVGDVTVPKFGELALGNNFEEIRKLWHQMIVTNALITIPIVCFCFGFAVQIITVLFSAKYVASAAILRINLAILLIKMLGSGYILFAVGDTRSILISHFGRFIISIPVAYLLIVKAGLLGAAIAYVLGIFFETSIQLNAVKKVLNISLADLIPWEKLFAISICSVIPAFLLTYLVNSKLSVILSLLVGISTYFPTILILFNLLGYLKVEDIKGIFQKTYSATSS